MDDETMAAAFDPILNKGEMIQAIYKPKKSRFLVGPLFGSFFFALFVSIWPIFAFCIPWRDDNGKTSGTINPLLGWLLFGGIFLLILIVTFVVSIVRYRHVLYAYTDTRILIRDGFIGVDFRTLDLKQIQATEVRVDFVDKLTGGKTGSIAFGSNSSPMVSGGNNSNVGVFRFIGIADPYGTLKTIKEAIENASSEK
ncbi:MAG: hypothetical protein BWY98_00539 [Tenericutes bacterium ADurb.BinA155]|jgi:hypothetical protein|nr:MAG: hypothetical protein BWY98_00539 [Tenericutes bacterium ADurb.BinA155]